MSHDLRLQEECRKSLGNFLRLARGKTNLREVAERLTCEGLKMSTSNLSRIESGKIGVEVANYKIICRAYKANYIDLINSLPRVIQKTPTS